MSKNLEFCLDLFKLMSISRSESNKLKVIKLLNCSSYLNSALHEITMNLLLENLIISDSQKQQLKQYRRLIHKLSKKTCIKRKITNSALSEYIKYLQILMPSLHSAIAK